MPSAYNYGNALFYRTPMSFPQQTNINYYTNVINPPINYYNTSFPPFTNFYYPQYPNHLSQNVTAPFFNNQNYSNMSIQNNMKAHYNMPIHKNVRPPYQNNYIMPTNLSDDKMLFMKTKMKKKKKSKGNKIDLIQKTTDFHEGDKVPNLFVFEQKLNQE